MPITVLVADEGEIIRWAISGLLGSHPAVQVVGEARDLAETTQLARDLKPQVIVMDLHMLRHGRGSDYDVERLSRGSKLLAISLSKGEEAESLAARLGAAKVLDKINLYDELIPTIVELALPSASTETIN
jgi:DNA-binding NarL/FixJ family response regulator